MSDSDAAPSKQVCSTCVPASSSRAYARIVSLVIFPNDDKLIPKNTMPVFSPKVQRANKYHAYWLAYEWSGLTDLITNTQRDVFMIYVYLSHAA